MRALLGRLLLVLLLVAAGGGGVWLLTGATGGTATPRAEPDATDIPALQVTPADVEPGSVVPDSRTVRPQATRRGVDPLIAWARELAGPTGVPARALAAYGNAELVLRVEQPGCRVSWATLAGIGRIESDHGRFGGATLGADGRPSKPIIGVPLDGSPGVRTIADTDGGVLDGDPTVDRAVGPMQFIPSTWRSWAADGDLDGRGDPQQIDDAALAAARYLCADGRDLSTPDGWWSAVLSYNHSTTYGQKVFGLADEYARTALSVR